MADRHVVDASVAAKWFLRDALERDVDLAENLLRAALDGNLELHVPGIFTFEVCNLLAKACGKHPVKKAARLTPTEACASVEDLHAMPLQIADSSVKDKLRALEMSATFSKLFYDMTYLCLAEKLDCQWITADARVLHALPSTFPRHRVLLLSELRMP